MTFLKEELVGWSLPEKIGKGGISEEGKRALVSNTAITNQPATR